MVIDHLGRPEKFARVTGAVTATPRPTCAPVYPPQNLRVLVPVRPCVRLRAYACAPVPVSLLTLTCALSQRKNGFLGFTILASRATGNGERLALRKGVASVFRRCRSALQRTRSPFAMTVPSSLT
jgi:hypothetical protein